MRRRGYWSKTDVNENYLYCIYRIWSTDETSKKLMIQFNSSLQITYTESNQKSENCDFAAANVANYTARPLQTPWTITQFFVFFYDFTLFLIVLLLTTVPLMLTPHYP